jgi:hypothetical protein
VHDALARAKPQLLDTSKENPHSMLLAAGGFARPVAPDDLGFGVAADGSASGR